MKMNLATAITSITIALVGVQAHAAPTGAGAPARATTTRSPGRSRGRKSRPTALWKQAGLDKLEQGESGPDIYSAEYREAYANYLRMRRGPEYAAGESLTRPRENSVRASAQFGDFGTFG